jgi:hypothetical protein
VHTARDRPKGLSQPASEEGEEGRFETVCQETRLTRSARRAPWPGPAGRARSAPRLSAGPDAHPLHRRVPQAPAALEALPLPPGVRRAPLVRRHAPGVAHPAARPLPAAAKAAAPPPRGWVGSAGARIGSGGEAAYYGLSGGSTALPRAGGHAWQPAPRHRGVTGRDARRGCGAEREKVGGAGATNRVPPSIAAASLAATSEGARGGC